MCQKVKASVLIEQYVIGSMQGYSRSMSWAPVWRSIFPFHFLHAFDNALSMRSKWLKMYAHAYCIWIFPWNRQAREWRDENWVLSCITCANFFHVQHILRVECVTLFLQKSINFFSMLSYCQHHIEEPAEKDMIQCIETDDEMDEWIESRNDVNGCLFRMKS